MIFVVQLVIETDESLKASKSYYLGDPEEIAEAAVAEQGKAK